MKELRLTDYSSLVRSYHVYFHDAVNINQRCFVQLPALDPHEKDNRRLKENILDGFVVPKCFSITDTDQENFKLIAIGLHSYQRGKKILKKVVVDNSIRTFNKRLDLNLKEDDFNTQS